MGFIKRTYEKKKYIWNDFIKDHIREFCDKTTIHGLRYVTEYGANWLQSLMWASFVTVGVVFCAILMLLIWDRFYHNPTITAVETINYPVWKVNFPAITVCNVNKVHKLKINNITKLIVSNGIDSERATLFFKSLSNLIHYQQIPDNFTDVFQTLQNNGYNTEKLMLEVMHPCNEFLKRCTWMGNIVNCQELFNTVKTDEGFCCAFNYQHTNETYNDYNFVDEKKYKEIPLRVAGAGIHTGLSVVLDLDDKQYLSATRIVPSALVHIHDYLDYAEMKILAMVVEKGELVQIPVDPSIIDATSDVRSLDPSRRNCVFEEDVYLSIGAYGYENCIIECRMNAIVDFCGCIPFYYNVKNYTYKKNLRFCEIYDAFCINLHQRELYTLRSVDVVTLDNSSSSGLNCSCFPTCDVNWYTYTSDTGHMVQNMDGYQTGEIIALHVYFSEFSCIKYKQSNLITWDGLFASFGGIFGLCLGGSILSVVEIVYHFTVKLYMAFKEYKKSTRGKVVKMNKWNKALTLNYQSKRVKRSQVVNFVSDNRFNEKFVRDRKTIRGHNKSDIFFISRGDRKLK